MGSGREAGGVQGRGDLRGQRLVDQLLRGSSLRGQRRLDEPRELGRGVAPGQRGGDGGGQRGRRRRRRGRGGAANAAANAAAALVAATRRAMP